MNSEITVTPKGDTLILLEGKALEPKHPEKLRISGQIESVNKYLAARRGTLLPSGALQYINRDLAVITVDEDKMTIELDVDPNNPFGTEVLGALQFNPELAAFQINKPHKFSREALLDLIRFHRRFFNDLVEQSNVVNSLQRLSVSATSNIGQMSDNRGNRDAAFKKVVDSAALPESFALNIPIFKGQPAKKFRVDLCLDTTEQSVRFWLESVELVDVIDVDKKTIIQAQLKDYLDYCIIWK